MQHPNDTYVEHVDKKTGEITGEGRRYTLRENGSWLIEDFNAEPTQTQQQFADQADINNIMKNYPQLHLTGTGAQTGVFADLTNLPDFQAAHDIVMQATNDFMALPAELRKEFDNSPQKLVEFLRDEKNRDKAITLGLIPKPDTQPNYQAEILNELKSQNRTNKSAKKQVETDPD